MSTKAEEVKHITCSACGAPLWGIRDSDGELVEYACLKGHLFTYRGKQINKREVKIQLKHDIMI